MANPSKPPKFAPPSPAGGSKPAKPQNGFTLDSEITGLMEVPSVTRLLNRKKLGLGKGANEEPSSVDVKKPAEPPASPPSFEAPLNLSNVSDPSEAPAPAFGKNDISLSIAKEGAPEFKIETSSGQSVSPPSSAPALSLAPSSSEIKLELSSDQPLDLVLSPAAPSPPNLLNPVESQAADSPFMIEAPAPAPVEAPVEIPVEAPKKDPAFALKIQPSARKADRRGNSRLILWETGILKSGLDPLGKGLALLLEKGAEQALFLAITAPPPGSPVPHFLATAAVAPREKLGFWTGLKWNPTVVPELWNQFVKTGQVEIPPASMLTRGGSKRPSFEVVVRQAFGAVEEQDYLLLIRCGPASACRGVLAVISKKSMLSELAEASQLIGSLPTPAKAA
jgi:hypothetical protein